MVFNYFDFTGPGVVGKLFILCFNQKLTPKKYYIVKFRATARQIFSPITRHILVVIKKISLNITSKGEQF